MGKVLLYSLKFISYSQSDGVVTASSQQAFPGAATIQMIGTNHQQMRNHSQTRIVLNAAYNGALDPYFITPTK
jgi:hypothetical protein